jgi:hypothetical protein
MSTIDASSDYQYWDNTEAVTVSLVRDSTTTVSISAALQQDVSRRTESYLGVHVTGDETIWHVPNALLNPASNGREILIDDLITDAGGLVWAVVAVTRAAWKTRWECLCRRRRAS